MTPRFTRTLKYELPLMRGNDVLALQRRLRQLGLTQVGEPDGIFGPATGRAVRDYQTKQGVKVDGIVGPVTWERMFLDEAGGSDATDQSAGLLNLLPVLIARHTRFPELNGVQWQLTPDGISLDGQPAVGTAGEPQTVRNVWNRFGDSIRRWSVTMGVPAELIVATICTESGGNERAVRHEPGYQSDEATPGRVSPGLMQTLISTARATLHLPQIDSDWLYVPDNSIRAGTAYIAQQSGITNYDPPLVACAYNAGSLRPNDHANNRWKMVQYPINTGEHADRFVSWFNDVFRMYRADGNAPPSSFFQALAAAATVRNVA